MNGQMSATVEYSYEFRGLGLLLLFQAYCFGMYSITLITRTRLSPPLSVRVIKVPDYRMPL